MLYFQSRFVLVLSVFGAILAGCASTPEPTGFLKNYDTLQPGKYLDRIEISPAFHRHNYSTILIKANTPLRLARRKVSLENYVNYLERETIAQLRQSGLFANIMQDEEIAPSTSKSLRCELAITELDPGSQAMRWWFGELGAGHSVIQVEGRLSDAQTGEELLTFIETRRGAAIFDITGGDSQALIEQDLREVVKGLLKELYSL